MTIPTDSTDAREQRDREHEPSRCYRHPWKPAVRMGFCKPCASGATDLELIEQAADFREGKQTPKHRIHRSAIEETSMRMLKEALAVNDVITGRRETALAAITALRDRLDELEAMLPAEPGEDRDG